MCSLDCRQNWDEIRTSVVAQHTADTEQAAHSRRRLETASLLAANTTTREQDEELINY